MVAFRDVVHGLKNVFGFQEWHQFIYTKISEHLTCPIHGGSFGLTGQVDHGLHGLAIARDDNRSVGNAFRVEELNDFFAPRTASFDVECGINHG